MTQEELARMFGINLNDDAENNSHGKGSGNRNQNNRNDNRGSRQNNSRSQNNFSGNRNTNNRNDNRGKQNFNNVNLSYATAPYNFVELPAEPLTSEISSAEKFSEHIKDKGKLSGEIILEIETLTPMFIGGNPNDATISFSPLGTPIIAGSTLRGMFKNIFKIMTCGTFRGRTDSQKKGEDFNDEHIYYRCLMGVNSMSWTKDLNKEYNSRMTSNVKGADGKFHVAKNARPGFLIQTKDNKYFIAPSIHANDLKNDKVFIKEYERDFHVRIPERNSSCVEWRGKIAYIITGSQSQFRLHDKNSYDRLNDEQKKRAGKQFIRFTKIDYVDWSREHWRALPDDVRLSYEHDRNRRGVNLFTDKGILNRDKLSELVKNLPDDIKTLVPCHFLEEDGKITAFGHGQCFRIPYRNSIGDLIPKNLNDTKFEMIDFADAIFGRDKHWASRVCFDDAVPSAQIRTLEKSTAHPLMQPNPTSYQLYLKQNLQQTGGILNHWDKLNAQIRGYKLYWHNSNWDWKANDSELALDSGKSADKRLTKDIKPLAKGNKFSSKIRFKNLSEVELGALMMIFDLNGNKSAAYKIGQGKPFGFGSVKITPKLFIENADAYENIFDADGWKNPYGEVDAKIYLDAFKNYIAAQNLTQTWEGVMKELNAILNWDKKPAPEKIKSMSGDTKTGIDERFKQRVPLKTIFEVVR